MRCVVTLASVLGVGCLIFVYCVLVQWDEEVRRVVSGREELELEKAKKVKVSRPWWYGLW